MSHFHVPFLQLTQDYAPMTNDLQVMSYDLKVYLRGFEVALSNNDIKDAVGYLEKIRYEAEQNLEFLAETYSIKKELG